MAQNCNPLASASQNTRIADMCHLTSPQTFDKSIKLIHKQGVLNDLNTFQNAPSFNIAWRSSFDIGIWEEYKYSDYSTII